MAKSKNILIYTTPSCIWCIRAKDFFKKNKIIYKEINVAADSKAAQEMIQKSGQMGVPVIEIDGEIIIGFDESRVKELLGI